MSHLKTFSLCLVLILSLACNRQQPTKVATERPLYLGQEIDFSETLTTIALGSCDRQDLPQTMWPFITENDPQLWLWLGDNIYGDSEDMQVMKQKYLQQKYGAAYSQFRAQVPVLGIWDDHDFGVNDGGNEYSKRDESMTLMLDFLDVDPDSPVRKQKGAYQAYEFGPEGQKVAVIMLDSRYHRDKPIKNPNGSGYQANETGTILGEEQWKWLETVLSESDAQVHILGNGIQVIPQEHRFEKWHNFPKERQRLLDLLSKYQIAHPILLSGDRHIAEISRMDLPGLDWPVYELTSSGLTHSYDKVGAEPNRYRVSDIIGKLNFGIIRIDWTTDKPKIELEVRGLENKLLTTAPVDFEK